MSHVVEFVIRVLLLITTAEAYVLVENSYCTKADGQSGVCKVNDGCPELRGAAARRKSRRLSCFSQKMVCCPTGRRRSSVQKVVYKRLSNEQCVAAASARPPAPGSGCCGLEVDVANRILGGTTPDLEQSPWMALLEYRDDAGLKTDHTCGATLISSRYVVTAAHCITAAKRDSAAPVAVLLSEYDRSTSTDCVETEGGGADCVTSTRIEVEEIHVRPGSDVAIMRLKRPAPYTDFIRPICLPSKDVTLNPQEPLHFTVTGWGLTEDSRSASKVKQQVQIPFVSKEECRKIYKDSRKFNPDGGQICAGGVAGRDSCKGDSGGPLVYHNGLYSELTGVISYGYTVCGSEGVPAVHTNLFSSLDWIHEHIRD